MNRTLATLTMACATRAMYMPNKRRPMEGTASSARYERSSSESVMGVAIVAAGGGRCGGGRTGPASLVSPMSTIAARHRDARQPRERESEHDRGSIGDTESSACRLASWPDDLDHADRHLERLVLDSRSRVCDRLRGGWGDRQSDDRERCLA